MLRASGRPPVPVRLQGGQPVGAPLPGFLFGFQRDVWQFLQLNWERVGLVREKTLALPWWEAGGKGAFSCWNLSLWTSRCSNPDLQALKRPVHSALFFSAGPCSTGFRHHSGPIQPMQADLTGLCALSKPLYPGEPQLHHL